MSVTRLSVVMPAYNEEAAIEEATREVQRHVFAIVADAELVVVDDGSCDHTGEILDRLAIAEPRMRVIHQKNGGHGRAVRAGLDAAKGEFVFLVDSDRQIGLDAFATVWELAQSRDAALGVRVERKDPWLRLKLTALVRGAIRVLFGIHLRDANVPFKIVCRSAWLAARPLISPDTLAPSLFLALFLRLSGANVAEMVVPHRERQTGVTSIHRWKLIIFSFRAFVQLISYRGKLKRWVASHTS